MTGTSPPSNWGRWSDDDEIGALNLVTPERVRAAAGLVADGRVVSLGRVIRRDVVRSELRSPPTLILTVDGGDYAAGALRSNGVYFADDYLSMPVATGTHIDSLAHAWSDDGLYNGHDPRSVHSWGAKLCGIDKVSGIVTAGVLADICRLHGVDTLAPSHVITPAQLEAATIGLGNDVLPGDALLVRTGWLREDNLSRYERADALIAHEPGLGLDAAQWIADKDIAFVGADNVGVEVKPSENPDVRSPLHVSLISRLGVYLIELLDLEELASHTPGRFLFVAAPLRLRGAVNSPLNPLAIL